MLQLELFKVPVYFPVDQCLHSSGDTDIRLDGIQVKTLQNQSEISAPLRPIFTRRPHGELNSTRGPKQEALEPNATLSP